MVGPLAVVAMGRGGARGDDDDGAGWYWLYTPRLSSLASRALDSARLSSSDGSGTRMFGTKGTCADVGTVSCRWWSDGASMVLWPDGDDEARDG